MEEEKKLTDKVIEQVEEAINGILEQKVQPGNADYLYKLIDIHKDIKNEEYWKEEKNMRYGNYGESYGESYGRRGVPGTGRGRYRDSYNEGNYGRRGNYRGEEIMDDMYQAYQEYNEGKENYGADGETMESFKYMLKAFKDYYKHLKQEASSQEEVKLLEKTAKEIGMM